MEPKYIQSTYSEIKNMGFIGWEITYTWDEDADFVDEELQDYEGTMETTEIMAPWENLDILKSLICNDYGLPKDEVDILRKKPWSVKKILSGFGTSSKKKI